MSAALRSELENFLETLNIRTSCVEHPPVRSPHCSPETAPVRGTAVEPHRPKCW